MSVIGRLDEQVDRVLITPLKKRSGHEAESTPQDTRPHRGAEPAPERPSEAPRDGRDSEISKAAQDELPVWLL